MSQSSPSRMPLIDDPTLDLSLKATGSVSGFWSNSGCKFWANISQTKRSGTGVAALF